MEAEKESLDLFEPTQREGDVDMSEEIEFEDEKSHTEELQTGGKLCKQIYQSSSITVC